MRLAALLVPLAFAPVAAHATPTIECHCFEDRSFDPARPAAADPYVLATMRSSLLSAAFGVGKSTLVRAVMGGTSPEDLWIAQWSAARTGDDPDALLEARRARGSWKAALASVRTGALGPAFAHALARGATELELAALAVDDVLTRLVHADPVAVTALRAARATTEETIAATVLAPRLAATPAQLLAPVKAGKTSWGALLHAGGITPEQLDGIVRESVR